MRIVKILLPVLTLLVAASALAGELSPGLEAYLAEKHAGGDVKVLVVLEDQVDVTGLDLELHYQRADLATRHARVVTALQEKAEQTQGPLIAALESRKGAGIAGWTSYWLINAITVTGSEEAIRELAARQDVDVVEIDLVPQLIEPVEERAVAGKSERGVGITPGVVAIGARRVWDELGIRGEGALIGSLDTGVDGNHPAIASRWRGTHAPADECWLDVVYGGTSFPSDNNSHGTHTVGTMAGVAPDDTIGVAPASEWIAANAIDQGANPGFDNDIIMCLQFFTDPDGNPFTIDDVPDVVQNSWGVNENFSGYVDCDSRWWTAIDACEAAGVVLTWSAGNEGPSSTTLRSPADRATTLYNCFSVGSTLTYAPYNISSFSSRGPAGPSCGPVENRTKPEISAPGSDVYSSVPGGGYGFKSGTSMAGPHVAGVVALMRSANPNVDVITIKQVLMETANDLGTVGEDNTYGHGFLDAYEAVLYVMGGIGYIEGTVVDDVTGLPIAGARVEVLDGPQASVTGVDGTYSLTLPEGEVTLVASGFGYADAQITVSVVEDQTLTQDVALEALPSASLTGTVYAAGQAPMGGTVAEGAQVLVADTPLAAVTTGADGRFAFSLPVGDQYTIQAGMPGDGAISQLVPVDGDLDVDLYLSDLTQDGFETGDLSALGWTTSGDANWFVQSGTTHEGGYAAQSGDIGDQDNSALEVTVDCGAGGEVSFWYKVSSEANYDYLQFSIDGGLVDEWAGEIGWTQYTTTVSAGTHTFRWNYDKDWSVSDGSDCGWIDGVVFPGGGLESPLAVATPWSFDVTLEPGQTSTLPLVVMNQGTEALDFTATAGGYLSLGGASGQIAAYGYQVVEVTFSAAALLPGLHSTDITLTSNDPANPTLTIPTTLEVTGDVTPVETAPAAFALLGAVPNPFNPQTTVRYSVPATGHVRLDVYDVQGRLVRTLVDGTRSSGVNEARWDGRDATGRGVASGTYFARLRAGGQQSVKSLTLVR
jgi:subtilisin family serine protease